MGDVPFASPGDLWRARQVGDDRLRFARDSEADNLNPEDCDPEMLVIRFANASRGQPSEVDRNALIHHERFEVQFGFTLAP